MSPRRRPHRGQPAGDEQRVVAAAHGVQDELFVRTARAWSPRRARWNWESVHTLQQEPRLMTSDIQFDPSSTQRQFSLRMSDLVGTLVLPALMARVDAAAPGLAIDTVHLSPEQTIGGAGGRSPGPGRQHGAAAHQRDPRRGPVQRQDGVRVAQRGTRWPGAG